MLLLIFSCWLRIFSWQQFRNLQVEILEFPFCGIVKRSAFVHLRCRQSAKNNRPLRCIRSWRRQAVSHHLRHELSTFHRKYFPYRSGHSLTYVSYIILVFDLENSGICSIRSFAHLVTFWLQKLFNTLD